MGTNCREFSMSTATLVRPTSKLLRVWAMIARMAVGFGAVGLESPYIVAPFEVTYAGQIRQFRHSEHVVLAKGILGIQIRWCSSASLVPSEELGFRWHWRDDIHAISLPFLCEWDIWPRGLRNLGLSLSLGPEGV